jgi:hypothetical protein
MAKLCVGTERRIKSLASKPENFNAHGQLYYQTLVLSEPHLSRIEKQVLSRWGRLWYRELQHPDFTLRAFSSGRCMVFAHSPTWRSSLTEELSKIWDQKAVSAFNENLQVNGSTLELAIALPGVPSGQHYEDKAGLVSIDTDHTPKDQGNIEIKVNIGEFDRRFSAMEQQIAQLATSGGYLGFQQFKDMIYVLVSNVKELIDLIRSTSSNTTVGNSIDPKIGNGIGSLPSSDPPTVLIEPSPASIRCPRAKELSLGIWFCGSRIVFERGHARMVPLRCFHPGFEKCPYYG